MISRSDRSIPISGTILILLIIMAVPRTAWVQEPAKTVSAPSGTAKPEQAGTLVMPGSAATPPADTNGQQATHSGAGQSPASSEQAGQYVIKEGDTLWDIAAAHYRDPFLWPLIWQANPEITDPDLIYPGRSLVIPSLAPVERAMSAPQAPEEEKVVAEKPAPVATEPAKPETPSFFKKGSIVAATPEPETPAPLGGTLVLPKETIPPIADKYLMLSAGFVSEQDSDDYVIGSSTDPEKSILGHDDYVYISIHSRPSVTVDDRFIIYQPISVVKHPTSNRYYGELYKILGVLRVTKVNEEGSTTATAKIILSFDAAEKGSLLMPYQEPTLLYPLAQRPIKNLTGQILEVTDRRSINGQVDVVYLDKGKEDGVDPGDRYVVFTDGGNDSRVTKTIGEVEVILVKTRTATAVVKKSVDAITRGDKFRYKN